MKIRFYLIAALSGALLLTGCTTRDDDGAPPPPSAKKSKKPAKRSGKNRRDPVDDMFLGLSKREEMPDFAADEQLNKRERNALKESRKWQDDEMRELRRSHDRFDEQRKERKRWVYGLKSKDEK